MIRTLCRLAAILGVLAAVPTASALAMSERCDAGAYDCPVGAAPEPATLSMLALGVAGLVIARRRK